MLFSIVTTFGTEFQLLYSTPSFLFERSVATTVFQLRKLATEATEIVCAPLGEKKIENFNLEGDEKVRRRSKEFGKKNLFAHLTFILSERENT